MKVLVTGASGFVGTVVAERLAADGHEVVAAARSAALLPNGARWLPMGDLGRDDDPVLIKDAIDSVVHTAARVHTVDDHTTDPLSEFRRINVEGSLAVARSARAAGATRFVFLSSIKVFGESSPVGRPWSARDPTQPSDAYGRSKLEAEQALASYCTASGMELVVIRPPLVYGRGVKANFERLMRAVAQSWPLPFGSITGNRRSLVAVDNLAHLISVCLTSPSAACRTFLVSDGEDLSTAELTRRLARALEVRRRLISVPVWALRLVGAASGRRAALDRLCGSMQADITETLALGWVPPVSVDEGLARAAAAFKGSSSQ
jgi:nucleoside-diphosphate-sugar epimerase